MQAFFANAFPATMKRFWHVVTRNAIHDAKDDASQLAFNLALPFRPTCRLQLN